MQTHAGLLWPVPGCGYSELIADCHGQVYGT